MWKELHQTHEKWGVRQFKSGVGQRRCSRRKQPSRVFLEMRGMYKRVCWTSEISPRESDEVELPLSTLLISAVLSRTFLLLQQNWFQKVNGNKLSPILPVSLNITSISDCLSKLQMSIAFFNAVSSGCHTGSI